MRKTVLFFMSLLITFSLVAQEYKELQAIGELSDGLIAIQKEGKWGFIDTANKLVIDFRDDIAIAEYGQSEAEQAPKFNNGRCLIVQKKDGIPYYGYINIKGEVVVEPQYLNATNFSHGYAIVVMPNRNVRGKNEYLNMDIVRYTFYEIVIDTQGTSVAMLREMPHILMSEEKFEKPYSTTHFVSETQIALQTENDGWQVVSLASN